MSLDERMQQILNDKYGDTSGIDTMKLFFIGDLPHNKVLNVPRISRQSKIFDQFAHREMFKRIRSKNARNFKPLMSEDTPRKGGSLPRCIVQRIIDEDTLSNPTNSMLLRQRLNEVKGRLPSILYNRSMAQVMELIGNGRRSMPSPNLQQERQIERHFIELKRSPDKCERRQQEVKENQEQDELIMSDKMQPTVSTESQSPEAKSMQMPIQTANEDRIKIIVNDIVKKTQIKNSPQVKITRRSLIRLNPQPQTVSLPVVTPTFDSPVIERRPAKGYLVHDEACFNFWSENKQNVQVECEVLQKFTDISAEQFCILNCNTLRFRAKKTNRGEIQIASLSKIVTCLLTILVCRKYNIDYQTYKCRVSDEAAEMPGTSAELETGDMLTIQNLLYGLMLPSGNDAAVTLAENVGRIIQKHKKKPSVLSPLRTFIRHMNILYKQLLLTEDQEQEHLFQNPSGLSMNPNKTSAEQITLIAAVAMRNSIFQQVVSTKDYQITFKNQRYGLQRKLVWKNTNKLLWKEWEGVKTGTTETAGHCFIGKFGQHLVSVFDCATLNRRFSDASRLAEWLKN